MSATTTTTTTIPQTMISHTVKESLTSSSSLKLLPEDPNKIRLSVGCVSKLTAGEVDGVVEIFNKYGAVVLTPETVEDSAAYQQLDTLLGVRAPHEKKNKEGIVVIDPFQPNSIGVADTEKAHMAHTDESFLDEPSKIMTLQCRVKAADNGGESFLSSGAKLVNSVLTPEEVAVLMKPGMVTVGRTLPGLTEGRVSTQPLIWEENGSLQVRWRSKDSYIKYIAPEAEVAFEKMSRMGMDAAHQLKILLEPHELMIVDNRANAHGRCPFADGLARCMWRVNYNGNGTLAGRLNVGFQAATEPRGMRPAAPTKCVMKRNNSAKAA